MAHIKIEVVDDRSPEQGWRGFLRLRRLQLCNVSQDGRKSETYAYDIVERRHLDAVAMVLCDRDTAGHVRIMLRDALRPPLFFRLEQPIPLPEAPRTHALELPAGLIEPSEHGMQGILACAARETREETGLDVPAHRFTRLGPPVLLSPGLCAEKVHFVRAEVDLDSAHLPSPDGVVEQAGRAMVVRLDHALRMLGEGEIDDAKTEIGLRRIATLEV